PRDMVARPSLWDHAASRSRLGCEASEAAVKISFANVDADASTADIAGTVHTVLNRKVPLPSRPPARQGLKPSGSSSSLSRLSPLRAIPIHFAPLDLSSNSTMNTSQAAAQQPLIVAGYRADAGRVVVTRVPLDGAPSPNVVLHVDRDADGGRFDHPAPSTGSGSDQDVDHSHEYVNQVRFGSPIFSSTSSADRYQGHDEYDVHGDLSSPAPSAVPSIDNYARSDVDDGAHSRLTSPALSPEQPIDDYANEDMYGAHGRFVSPALGPDQPVDNYADDNIYGVHGRFASPALSASQLINPNADPDVYTAHGRFASPALRGTHSVNGSVYDSYGRFASPVPGASHSVEDGGPYAGPGRLASPALIAFSPQAPGYTGDGDRTPTPNAREMDGSTHSLEHPIVTVSSRQMLASTVTYSDLPGGYDRVSGNVDAIPVNLGQEIVYLPRPFVRILENPESLAIIIAAPITRGTLSPVAAITHRKLRALFKDALDWYLKERGAFPGDMTVAIARTRGDGSIADPSVDIVHVRVFNDGYDFRVPTTEPYVPTTGTVVVALGALVVLLVIIGYIYTLLQDFATGVLGHAHALRVFTASVVLVVRAVLNTGNIAIEGLVYLKKEFDILFLKGLGRVLLRLERVAVLARQLAVA
ncbi:hypothetical protein TRAPUB_1069, partial [Trametes pubescens]